MAYGNCEASSLSRDASQAAEQTVIREGLSGRHTSELDDAAPLIEYGDTSRGLHGLDVLLRAIRQDVAEEEWRKATVPKIAAHRVAAIARLCPLTLRSYEKPRGYPGDAEMLDHIYGRGEAAKRTPDPPSLASRIYFYTVNRVAPQAVRYRAVVLGRLIDDLAARGDEPISALSIACGHLREAEHSHAFRCGRVAEFHAIDQDALSVDVVQKNFAATSVRPLTLSMRRGCSTTSQMRLR